MPHKLGDIFPVFDPITEEFLYYKPRRLVHTEGDWHRGVQANIIRPNWQGTFDILVQERSGVVDIGTSKFDQSLATQMLQEDGCNEDVALRRGLWAELGIEKFQARKIPANLRIVKTYKEHPGTLNRELINLYIVTVKAGEDILTTSPKIANLHWMEWREFLEFFRRNPRRFTKTGQFYFSDEQLLPLIETESYAMIKGERAPASHAPSIVHSNRFQAPSRTFSGPITEGLRQSGELH